MATFINHSYISNHSRKWRWIVVFIYILAIYAFLPFAPALWIFVLRLFGEKINFLGYLLIFLMGIYFLVYLVLQKREKNYTVYISFLLISFACIALLKYMCENGSERFHLLLYGILSVVLFWALRTDIKSKRIYIYTTIIAFLTGTIDECIQAALPMRYFDVRDILMNWCSSGLGELFIAFVLQPVLYNGEVEKNKS